MTWARRRKLIYLGSIAIIILVVVVIPAILYFYKTPTCFDGKQNQGEVGVDCGGPCTILCPAQYAPLTVLWSRFSKVTDGDYNVLAYIENPNINAAAYNLNYIFKLYSKTGVLLRERTGSTFVTANKIIGVFEADMQTGNQIPARVEFSFTSPAIWVKQVSAETGLAVSQMVVSRADTAPRLSFLLTNKNIKQINNIEAIGIVYNTEGNTIAFSRTIVDTILGQDSQTVNFNWPKPFTLAGQVDTYAKTEIILKILK